MVTRTDKNNSESYDENTDINQRSTNNDRGKNENSNNNKNSNNTSFVHGSIVTTEPNKEEQHQKSCIEGNQENYNKKSLSSSCETRYKNDKHCVVSSENKISATTTKAKQKYGKRDRAEGTEEDKESTVDVRSKRKEWTTKRKEEELSSHNSTTSKLEHIEEEKTTITKKKSKSKQKNTNCNNEMKSDQVADKCFKQLSTKSNREEYISEKQQYALQEDKQQKNVNESKFANFALLNAFGWEMCNITSEPVSEATLNERQYGYDAVKWIYTLRHVANKETLVLSVVTSACNSSSASNNHIHENKQETIQCREFIDDGKNVRKVSNHSSYECEYNKNKQIFSTHIESINGQKYTSQHDAVLFLLSKSITAMISAHGASKNLSGKEEFMETSQPTHLLSENNNHLLHTNTSSFLASEWQQSIGASDEYNYISTKIDSNANCTAEIKQSHFAKTNVMKQEEEQSQEQQERLEEKREPQQQEEQNYSQNSKLLTPSLHIKKELQQKHVSTSSRKTFHIDLGHNLRPLSSITTLSDITFDNDKEREIELLNAFDEPLSSATSLEQTCLKSSHEESKANQVDTCNNNAGNVQKQPLSISAQYLKYVRSFSHDLNEIFQCISCTQSEFCTINCLSSVNKQYNSSTFMENETNESNIMNNTMSRCQEEQESEQQKQISSFADTMAHSLAEVVGSQELSGDALYAGVSALNQYYSEREQEKKKNEINFKMRKQSFEQENERGCSTSVVMQKDFSKNYDDSYSNGMWNSENSCNELTHINCSSSSCPSGNDSEIHKMCKYFPQPRRHTFLPIHGKVLRALQHNINYTVAQFHGDAKSFDILPSGIPPAPRIVIPRTYHRRHEWILHMTNSQDKTKVDNDMDCSVKMNASRQHVSFTPNPEYDIWEYVHRRFGRIENSATSFNATSETEKNNSENNKTVDVIVDNEEDSVNKEKDVNKSSEECLLTSHSHGNKKKEKKVIDMDRYLRANRDKIMPVPMPDVEWFYSDV